MWKPAAACTIVLVCGIMDKCGEPEKPKVGQKLEVVSAPDGAAVKIDGVSKGKTPLTLTDLAVTEGQEQTLTFELEGYVTVEKTIKWASAEQSVSATLETAAKERVITVKSTPTGATVYADGSKKGDTPVTFSLELEDGAEVNILVQKGGYSDITEKIIFADESTKALEYTFVKAGKLKYADLDKVLLKMEKKWWNACQTIPSDVCKFNYSVSPAGKVTSAAVSCSDSSINNCTQKMVKKMKFPVAEKGRDDNFTWYGQ